MVGWWNSDVDSDVDIIEVLAVVHAHVRGQDLRLLQPHVFLVAGVEVFVAAHYLFPALVEVKERVRRAPFELRLPLLLHLMLLLLTKMLQVHHLLVPSQIPRQQLEVYLVLLRCVVDIEALLGHFHLRRFFLLDVVVVHLDSGGHIIDGIVKFYILHLLLLTLLDLSRQFR